APAVPRNVRRRRILTSRSVPVYAGGTAAGTKAEQLFKAMNGTRGSSFTEPEWIILHPSDWQDIRLLKDTANQYLGGGPFLGAYGGPQVRSGRPVRSRVRSTPFGARRSTSRAT